jgi:hypothetical protein
MTHLTTDEISHLESSARHDPKFLSHARAEVNRTLEAFASLGGNAAPGAKSVAEPVAEVSDDWIVDPTGATPCVLRLEEGRVVGNRAFVDVMKEAGPGVRMHHLDDGNLRFVNATGEVVLQTAFAKFRF